MASITLHHSVTIQTNGELPKVGEVAPGFRLVSGDLKDLSLHDFAGQKKVLNIFPSVDTGTCAMSVRQFNSRAAQLENTTVLCISGDLPFAQKRFCGAEGLDKVVMLSLMRGRNFSKDYGLLMETGPLAGLTARAVVVLDANNVVRHAELVTELTHEPNYDAAIAALK